MILVHQVFQAKYGRGDELVQLFKEFSQRQRAEGQSWMGMRLLTDASGPFFTVVTQYEVESLGAWEQLFKQSMSQSWLGEWFGRMMPLVESGRREFYNIVE